MITKNFKIILTIFFIFFTLEAKSKNIYSKDFNSKELSNYFSGVISHNNQKNEQALKYFKSSKQLLNKHEEYSKRLILSLVLNQNVDRAIQEIKFLKNKNQNEFFEAQLLLLIDSINKKNFDKVKLIQKKDEIISDKVFIVRTGGFSAYSHWLQLNGVSTFNRFSKGRLFQSRNGRCRR